jgi:SNF2 family DNA or RNA helicase
MGIAAEKVKSRGRNSSHELILSSHVHCGMLTWFNHHGKNKFQALHGKAMYDVVLTTYGTVEQEKRRNRSGNDSLFSYHWKRIILDEGEYFLRREGHFTVH